MPQRKPVAPASSCIFARAVLLCVLIMGHSCLPFSLQSACQDWILCSSLSRSKRIAGVCNSCFFMGIIPPLKSCFYRNTLPKRKPSVNRQNHDCRGAFSMLKWRKADVLYRKNDERVFGGGRKNEVTILMDNRMASVYAKQGTGVEQNGKIFV